MQERPVAVTIFGILNIGFGLLGVGGLAASGAYQSIPNTVNSPFIASVAAFMDAMNKNSTYILWRNITVPLGAVAALVLAAAGVGLLLGKSWARIASIGYAIYEIVMVAANIIVLPIVLSGLIETSFQQYPSVRYVVYGVGLVGAVFSLVYPVLLIFFLTRPKVRAFFDHSPVPPVSAS